MEFRIEQFVKNNEVKVVVVAGDGVPILAVTEYLQSLRQSARTKLLIARSLIVALDFFSIRKIDIWDRFKNFEFFSHNELAGLAKHLSLKKSDKKIVALTDSRVTRQVHQGRVYHLKGFFEYLTNESQMYELNSESEVCIKRMKKIDAFRLRLVRFSRFIHGKKSQQTRNESVGVETLVRIYNQVDTAVAEMWKKQEIQARNAIIFKILAKTGLRIGALASLKISGLHNLNERNMPITLEIAPGNDIDTGSRISTTPTNKSKKYINHELDKTLSNEIRVYYQKHRKVILRSGDTTYSSFNDSLLVTRSRRKWRYGEGSEDYQMTMSMISNVLQKIGEKFGVKLTAHKIRSTYSEILYEHLVRSEGDITLPAANSKMGWTVGSNEFDRYARKKKDELITDLVNCVFDEGHDYDEND